MKKIYTLLCALMMTGLGFGQTTFYTESFETENVGYTFTANSGKDAQDFFERTDLAGAPAQETFAYAGFDGTFFIAGEDIDGILGGTGSSVGEVLISGIDITNQTNLQFTAAFASGTDIDIDEPDDAMWVEVNIDNTGWVEIGRFEADPTTANGGTGNNLNGQFAEDTDGDFQGDGALLNGTFTDFTFPIAGTGSSMDVRISMDLDSGDEEAAFDNVRIAGDLLAGCTEPTTQASNAIFNSLNSSSFNYSWTEGSENNTLVVMREGSPVDTNPTNGVSYGGGNWPLGDEIGTGNYVIKSGGSPSGTANPINPSTTYHLAFYEFNAIDLCYKLPAYTTSFTTPDVTRVQFNSTSASVSEGAGTFSLVVEIANEDAVATTFDVDLISGDASDIDNFTIQSASFTGGSSTPVNVVITITDDAVFEEDEAFTFEIQNVAGGNSADLGVNTTFTLTIENNDPPAIIGLPYSEDFSDCSTVQWVPFSQNTPADDVWTCDDSGDGEYTMNGFSDETDIDWLISNFRVDFDAQTNESIIVETRNRFGNLINEAGEFQLLYSTDYAGFGDPTGATWNALTFDPANTSDSGTPSPATSTNVDASGLTGIGYLAFLYDMTGVAAEDWRITDISIISGLPPTSVEFTSTSVSVAETAGTYDLEIAITNEDATTATTLDVVLVSGDTADIDSFSSPVGVTFPAGVASPQTVTITITDDMIEELDEDFTFEIQNVAGGNSAVVGTNNSFVLTILANDAPIPAAGWQITSENTSFVVDFDNTVSGVNEGAFNGSGFTTPAASGQIDSESWETTGMSDGALTYGGSQTTGDNARGSSTGGVGSGGFYAFDTGGSNASLGFQGTGGDFTPGTITLRAQNQTGNTVTAADLEYLIYVYNDQGRSNSFNFSYSTDDTTYTDVVALDFASPEAGDGSPAWVATPRSTSITGLSIANEGYLYLRWTSDDVSGGGSRDEIAIDDIDLTFNPVAATTYTFTGTWAPSDPNGTATAGDDIVIASGDAVIDTNTTCNSVTVNPGAGLTVNTGITLTTSNGLTLESSATSYSSLILDGTVAGTLSYERHVNINGSGSTGSNDLISAPLTGQPFNLFEDANPNILAGSGATADLRLFGPFDKTTGEYVTYDQADTFTLDPGVGYRAASTDNGSFTFTGTANNGDVMINIINSGPSEEEWNLIGNPYPSYINVQDFLNHDVGGVTNIQLFNAGTAAIYGYDGNAQNGWTVYNLGTTTPSTLIAPGQGFFVSADPTNVGLYDLEFTADMRSTGSSDDFIVGRNAQLIYVKLNASTSSKSYNTDFYFNNNAGLGLDVGYDAEVWGNTTPDFAIYSHLVEDNQGKAIALQSLNPSDLSNVTIPLGVNANQGEQLTFSIAESTLPESVNVYLDDVVANTSTLLNTGDYVMTPTTDLSGTGRFFLRSAEDALSTIDSSIDAINIFALNSTKELVVSGQLQENAGVALYDIQGRKVVATSLDASTLENRIDVSALSAGVYVVTVENNGQQKTQKVILK